MKFLSSFLALGLLLFVQSVSAQKYLLKHRTYPHVPAQNFDSAKDFGPESGEVFQGRYFRIIQFLDHPNADHKAELKAKGIRFLEYLPNFSWIVSLPSDFDFGELKDYNVRSVFAISNQMKIREDLHELPYDPWVKRESGKIGVVLNLHRDVEMDAAWTGLVSVVEELENRFDYGKTFEVEIFPGQLQNIASLPFIAFIEPAYPPAETENEEARRLHRINTIQIDLSGSRNYTGKGVHVAMGDDGRIGPHIDIQGRYDNSNTVSDNGNHGDHVSGTIFSAGNLNPDGRGMAPEAFLFAYQSNSAMTQSVTAFDADSVRITSTSLSNGCNTGYTSLTRTADNTSRSRPSLLHVYSAGNEGTNECGTGSLGGTSYGAGTGWGTITGGHKMAKNVITVGALDVNENLAGFSSRGPAYDGRIKPEICGKGVSVFSTIDPNDYDVNSGTSMSCPGVSGVIATLYQAYREKFGVDPESALIKGIVMNTADDIGRPGPDFKHGFGTINALRAVKIIEGSDFKKDSVTNGGTRTRTISVPSGTKELRVMLNYLDPAASVSASEALVNDLNLEVKAPNNTVYLPWVLDHSPNASTLDNPAVRGVDSLNNMEQVTIDNPAAGTWTITVKGADIPQNQQVFYTIHEIRANEIEVTSPAANEKVKTKEDIYIRWDAPLNTNPFDIEYSADNGSNWSFIAQVDSHKRAYKWQAADTLSGQMLIRVKRGSKTGVMAKPFSIMRTPAGLTVLESCPTSVKLGWNAPQGVLYYETFKMGDKYMEPIDTSLQTSMWVNGISQFDEEWFAVRGYGPLNSISQRSIAIYRPPGLDNCSEPNDISVNRIIGPGEGLMMACNGLSAQLIKVELKSYSPNDITGVPVFYRVNSGNIISDTLTDTIPGFSTGEFTFGTGTVDFSNPGTYVLEVWTDFNGDNNFYNDTLSVQFEVVTGTTVSGSASYDLETFGFCGVSSNCANENCNLNDGWENAVNGQSDDIDWRTSQGSTPSFLTGPGQDHNPGNIFGRYMYLEATNCFEHEAHAVSPCFDLSGLAQPEFGFWFHLYGESMGELHVDVFADGQWHDDVINPMTADWSDKWWEGTVDLSQWAGKTVNIRFRGITGTGGTSDMALDDFSLYDASVSTEPDLNQSLSISPNPGTGRFRIESRSVIENIEVYNLSGQKIVAGTSKSADNYLLDLAEQPEGLYIVRIKQDGQWFEQKLILQR